MMKIIVAMTNPVVVRGRETCWRRICYNRVVSIRAEKNYSSSSENIQKMSYKNSDVEINIQETKSKKFKFKMVGNFSYLTCQVERQALNNLNSQMAAGQQSTWTGFELLRNLKKEK